MSDNLKELQKDFFSIGIHPVSFPAVRASPRFGESLVNQCSFINLSHRLPIFPNH